MTAWVLLWAWGFNNAITISNIASKEACEDLATRMGSTYNFSPPPHHCFEYRVAKS